MIDGKLDEPFWEEADPFSSFKMVKPTPGMEPSERTELRVLYTGNGLLIGIRCFDSEPKRIATNTMEHDKAEELQEDQISILLDPFQDKRSAYLFIVNARGARSEGFATGEHFTLGWDGLWEARCSIGIDGWTAEILIPFKTISFNPKLTSWGFNVERYIARKQEVIRFNGIALNSFFANPREAGILEGINNIKQGHGVTIRPYGLGAYNNSKIDSLKEPSKATAGIDIYKNITPNLVASVTYNTDFAETEVDERRLNLTRFPLYFPEKRTFFLEGSDIFDFGSTSTTSFLPFYSRRIGLYEGSSIPLEWGTKLFGKINNTNLSVLDVQSYKTSRIGAQNMLAARVSQNIFDESKIGGIFTNGSPTGRKNTLAGGDFRYKTSRLMGEYNFSVDLWGIKNWNERKGGNKNAFGMRIDYPNDLIDANISYYFFGDSLDPGLGFLPRNAYHNLNTSLEYMPRPEKGLIGALVRQWFFQFEMTNYWDLRGNLQSRQIFTAPVNFRTESGEHIEFNIIPNREVLPYDFEVAQGVTIPKGDYKFLNYRAEFNSASHRKIQVDISDLFGEFYDGHYNNLEAGLTLKMHGYANLQVGTNLVKGNMPEGKFTENIYFSRLSLYATPDLGLISYIQFDDVSNQIGFNGRLFWQIRPGNFIYLVYNNNTERVFDPERRLRLIEDQVLLKIQMSIRF